SSWWGRPTSASRGSCHMPSWACGTSSSCHGRRATRAPWSSSRTSSRLRCATVSAHRAWPEESISAIRVRVCDRTMEVNAVVTRKQVQAARRYVRVAERAASTKRTIARLPGSTRRDLGKQGDQARSRGGRAGHALEDRMREQLYELAKRRNVKG